MNPNSYPFTPPALLSLAGRMLKIPLYRNALILLATQGTIALSSMGFLVAITHLHSDDDVGIGAAFITATSLLSLVASFGFDFALIRFLPNSKDPGKIINSCITLSSAIAVVASLVFLAIVPLLGSDFAPLRGGYVSVLVVITAVSGVISMLQLQSFAAQRRPEYGLIQQVIFNFLRIPLAFALVAFDVTGICAAWAIALVVGIVIGNLYLRKAYPGYVPSPWISRTDLRRMLVFSSGNYFGNLATMAPGYILPLLILPLEGKAATGYFYVGLRAGQILFNAAYLVSMSMYVEGSHAPSKLRSLAPRSLLFTIALLLPALTVVFLFGSQILRVFGEEYSEEAVWVLRLVALSAIPFTINETFMMIRRVQLKVSTVVWFSALMSIATIGMAYPLIASMGVTGAGVAWLAGQALLSGWVVLWLLRHRMPGQKPKPHEPPARRQL